MMRGFVTYHDAQIEFEFEHKPNLKNCYITVSIDKGILVKAPTESLEYAKEFVLRKAKWILSKQKEQVQTLSSQVEFKTGARIPYLGKQYYLNLIAGKFENATVSFQQSKFEIQYDPEKHDSGDLRIALQSFYQDKAREKLSARVRYWTKQSNLKPESVRFKEMKTRWASCGVNNDISFSPELIKLPMSLIDYVIVHELAHIKYKNHSKEFWKLVRKWMPDYQGRHQQMNMKIF